MIWNFAPSSMSTSSNYYLSPSPTASTGTNLASVSVDLLTLVLSCLLKHRVEQWPLLVGSLQQPRWPLPATYFLTCSLGMSCSFSSPPCFLLLSLRLSLNILLSRKTCCFFLLFSFRLLILYRQSTFLDAYHLGVVNYDCNCLLEINSIDVYVCVCQSVCMCAAARGCQKRVLDALKLEWEVVVSHLIWCCWNHSQGGEESACYPVSSSPEDVEPGMVVNAFTPSTGKAKQFSVSLGLHSETLCKKTTKQIRGRTVCD